MTEYEMEFEFLIDNVRDAIIEWDDILLAMCPIVKIYKQIEESKVKSLINTIDFF